MRQSSGLAASSRAGGLGDGGGLVYIFAFPNIITGEDRATRELIVFLACLLTFLLYLVQERLRLDRALLRIPLRIAVTGTRGKSGVTRLIAAGLRESGARVLAKTTGSESVLIFPDGSEEKIPRPGSASIREQVRVVFCAARLGADAVVTELMSIGRECLFTESRRILRPGILALTNVRLDHLDAMGRSKEAIAATLSAAFPEGAAIFLPAEEVYPAFTETASRLGSWLGPVEEKIGDNVDLACEKFESNVRLALAVLHSLGVDRGTAFRGMGRALPDFGSLRIWRAEFGTPPRPAYCVSAFAANDPESSAAVLARVKGMVPPTAGPFVGLLCLREDRGDRTLQWVHAAGAGFFDGFESVAVLGRPAPAVQRKLRKVLGPAIVKFSFFTDPCALELMRRVVSSAGREPVVVGLGNIIGHGEDLLRYWLEVGTPYGR
jgi:poly-gamma-glutamate synthase PgsB/CapB